MNMEIETQKQPLIIGTVETDEDIGDEEHYDGENGGDHTPGHKYPWDQNPVPPHDGDRGKHPFLVTDGRHFLALSEEEDLRDWEHNKLKEILEIKMRLLGLRLMIEKVLKKKNDPGDHHAKDLCTNVFAVDGRLNPASVEALEGLLRKKIKKILKLLCKQWRLQKIDDDIPDGKELVIPLDFKVLLSLHADEIGGSDPFPELQTLLDEEHDMKAGAEKALDLLCNRTAMYLQGKTWPPEKKKKAVIVKIDIKNEGLELSRKMIVHWKIKDGKKKGQRTFQLNALKNGFVPGRLNIGLSNISHATASFHASRLAQDLLELERREIRERKQQRLLQRTA